MTDLSDDAAIDRLRWVLDRRSIKLTDLARRTGIPYRSLQNYMYKKSRIPLSACVVICQNIGITVEYLFDDKFKLDYHILKNCIHEVLGEQLDAMDINERLELTRRQEPIINSAEHRNRVASALAAFLSSAYDRGMERGIISGKDLAEDMNP